MRAANGYHRRICDELSKLGVYYVEEYPVGPYSVDIFLPEFPRLVEVDGPLHVSRRADEERIERILALASPNCSVVRIKVGTPIPEALAAILGDGTGL